MPEGGNWVPGSEWCGKPAVVVGTGPSITLSVIRTIALAREADRCRVIAVKDSVYLCWWADILFSGDAKFWANRGDLRRFPGRRVGLAESLPAPALGLSLVRRSGSCGLDPAPGFVRTHRNSGAMAVQLAADLGAAPIILAGFDMHARNGRHWFGENSWKSGMPDMGHWVSQFRALAQAWPGRIVTSTARSALDFLPVVDIGRALA